MAGKDFGQNKKYDSRLVEMKQNQGLLTKKDWEAHLAELPDLAKDTVPLTPSEDKANAEDQFRGPVS